MPQLPSPRLPGVTVLRPEATGPEYARWKRGLKSAFTSKGTWGHCDGSIQMPMPDAGPNFFSPVSSPTNSQPTLLEERRAWSKKDRDVKMDLFLSVADDIKLEVFEVGPPLPPSAMTAREMMEALDERFEAFKFEEYHHAFCHFLNLHIDQFSNIDDFNAEFLATLEDLLDHSHPMSNMQACSAYFSKLRCTQNPWVAKWLKEWDGHKAEPQLLDLMKQSPPWSIIRPLAMSTKSTSQQSIHPESIPEESLEDTPPQSDGEETPSLHSETLTLSSKSSHSRHSSNSTQRSQEITIHASYEDLTELKAFPDVPVSKSLTSTFHKRASSLSKLSLQSLPPPVNRPLPPLPADADKQSIDSSRSVSPNSSARKTSQESSLRIPTPPASSSSRPATPVNKYRLTPTPEPAARYREDVHPALRTTTPDPAAAQDESSIHPAVSKAPAAAGHISSAMRPCTPSPPATKPTSGSSSPSLTLTLAPADVHQRPQTSHSVMPPNDSFSSFAQTRPLLRVESSSSSVLSLPLQGATTPEYYDATITESPEPKKKFELSKLGNLSLGSSPPKTLAGRLSAESTEEERRSRKRSWSIKARLSARHGIKEII